jgi:GH24 family phage-related lysozyme (muramidase)
MAFLKLFLLSGICTTCKGFVLDPKIRERFSKASSTLEAIILGDTKTNKQAKTKPIESKQTQKLVIEKP